MRDSELEEGLNEWRLIERNSVGSAFLDVWANGQPDIDIGVERDLSRENAFRNTKDIIDLVDADGFKQAIEECAKEKGLVFEDLHKNMKNTLLRMDRIGTYFGRGIQLLAFERTAALAFNRIVWGFRLARPWGNEWIFMPVRSWVGTTASQVNLIGTAISRVVTPEMRSRPSQVPVSQLSRRFSLMRTGIDRWIFTPVRSWMSTTLSRVLDLV